MKALLINSCLVFTLLISCQSESKSKEINKSECLNEIALLKGIWQSSDFWDEYTEIEIADSLRCYVNHGYYIGPTIPEEYLFENDTLYRIEVGLKYHICITDSSTLVLTNHNSGKKRIWKRISPILKISDWSLEKDALFDSFFLIRQAEFE